MAPRFSGNLTAGYQIANIKIDKIGGIDPATAGSTLQHEDYSGAVVRLGISVHQPMGSSAGGGMKKK